MREAQCLLCFPLLPVLQFFESEDDAVLLLGVAKSHYICQQRRRRLDSLPEVVLDHEGHEHVGLESHFDRWITIQKQVERAENTLGWLADRFRCFLDLFVCQVAQELDRIKQVGLADSVGPDKARQRTEANINVAQVLESLGPQAE